MTEKMRKLEYLSELIAEPRTLDSQSSSFLQYNVPSLAKENFYCLIQKFLTLMQVQQVRLKKYISPKQNKCSTLSISLLILLMQTFFKKILLELVSSPYSFFAFLCQWLEYQVTIPQLEFFRNQIQGVFYYSLLLLMKSLAIKSQQCLFTDLA